MASKTSRLHGRVEGANARCAVGGCEHPGEYRAPVEPANFNGPGTWRLLCLDHVREHNSKYNYFSGMSPEEISDAQSPCGGWERSTRAFAAAGSDPPPAWGNFTDPLEAIAGRFRRTSPHMPSRFSSQERRSLAVLGLGENSDRHALRRSYSVLVRRFHPDRNGGDRGHEARLREVIEAYQLLRKAAAFA